MTKRSRRVAAGLDVTRTFYVTLGSQSQKARHFPRELAYKRRVSSESIALPFSQCPPLPRGISLFARACDETFQQRKPVAAAWGIGRALGRLKEVRSTQDKPGARDPQVPGTTERYSKTQSDILKRLRTLPASPAGGNAWGKRLAWPEALASGSYRSDSWPAHYTQCTAGERPIGCCDCCDADRRARLLACRAATR
jgi:hypothetical protein